MHDVTTLRQLLDYDPETGELTWRQRPLSYFSESAGKIKRPPEWSWRKWNTAFAGKPAFTFTDSRGVKSGAILRKQYKAHRICWAIYYGEHPSRDIDHINGNPSDNRIANLRLVSHYENMRNMKKPAHNSSGCVGVQFNKGMNKWQAILSFRPRPKHIGFFDTFEEAVRARKEAEGEAGFHPNHGR